LYVQSITDAWNTDKFYRANQKFRDQVHVWDAIGITELDEVTRKSFLAELSSDSARGQTRRANIHAAVERTSRDSHGLELEMSQRYSSDAVLIDDQNPINELIHSHHPSTYPGSKVPHAWLYSTTNPSKLISTIDVAGKGSFTLFTGIGGGAWKTAVARAAEELDVPITVHSIGFQQDYEDAYLEWGKLRGIDESGCVLIRPDRVVAWRHQRVGADCDELLLKALRKVLSL
jgi:hypothetical protein